MDNALRFMVTLLFGVSFAGYGYFLVAQRRCWTSAVSHLLHLAMSVAMILMAWGLGTKPPTIGAIICFLLAGAWFVWVAGRVPGASCDRPTNIYYAVMMAAMAWMYASMKGSLPGQSGHSTGQGMPMSAHDMSPPEPEPGWITTVNWIATLGPSTQFAWSGSETKAAEAGDPYRQAMNDLCQVLLNTNEFFYLH